MTSYQAGSSTRSGIKSGDVIRKFVNFKIKNERLAGLALIKNFHSDFIGI